MIHSQNLSLLLCYTLPIWFVSYVNVLTTNACMNKIVNNYFQMDDREIKTGEAEEEVKAE